MYKSEAEARAAAAKAWPTADETFGGYPAVFAWSPEGMAWSAVVANGIRASGGRCGR